jgi:hypothetical protein
MALHLTGQQIGARGNKQESRAVAHDTAGALEFFDFSIERFVIVSAEGKALGKVARCQRRTRRGKCF